MKREVLERYCASRGLVHVQVFDSFVIVHREGTSKEDVINDLRRMDEDSNKRHRIWIMRTRDVAIDGIYESAPPF